MSATEIMVNVGLLAVMILTQLGRRTMGPRRFLLPLALVAVAASYFLPGMPTVGGDLALEIVGTVAGVVFGLLAAAAIGMERDRSTGAIMATAGLTYAAIWLLVIGGRMAFAWWATNIGGAQIGRFSIEHQITGAAAWTAAFVLMALAMVCTRTAILALRTARLRRLA